MRSHTNMTMDANKAITAIEYNALNLPRRVTFADGHITEYLCDAAGEKLQTKYLVDNRTVFAAMTLGEIESDEVMEASDSTAIETLLTRDYCGDYIYEDRELERISTANGYISPSGVYTFYISDYQGNIVNLTPSSRTSNWNEYYPFGVHHSLTSSDRYLYSGKELDKTNGLYLYDFHTRHYDPMLARFTTIDPLCEKYYPISPYAYCAGNPIRYIDPTGMEVYAAQPDAQIVILNTLRPEDRVFVEFNKNGSIDTDLLNSHNSNSENFNSLKILHNTSDFNVYIKLSSDNINYKDNSGNIKSLEMWYDGVVEGFEDPNVTDVSGVTTGETGRLGITLLPGAGKSNINSIDNDIHVIINSKLSDVGAAEIYSHEANGHALMYVLTNDRVASGHQIIGMKDINSSLVNRILESRKETIVNIYR